MTIPSLSEMLSKVGGGGKYVAWDNVDIGTTVAGIILEGSRSEQQTDPNDKKLKFFDDGAPMMQVVIPIQGTPDPGIEGDDGKRQVAFRGGFTYESSFKGLVNELRRNKIAEPQEGDYIAVTRIANRKGKGMVARTHQFAVKYIKAEDFEAEGIKVDSIPEAGSSGSENPWE